MQLPHVLWRQRWQPLQRITGKSLYEQLIDIYLEYGLYKEKLINIVRKGAEGANEIKSMMTGYRNNPPKSINNSKVVKIDDYETLISTDCLNRRKEEY